MANQAEPSSPMQAEQSPPGLREEPLFLAQILDAVQHSIIAVDRQEKVTYWNRYATRLYGFTAEEALGHSINTLTARQETAAARQIMDTVWSGTPWVGEYPVAHRDGSSVPARVRLFPIFGPGHAVTGIIGVSEDISAELAARQELLRTKERFELLARSTSDAIWDWEVASDTHWGNDAYNALIGPTLPGQSPRDAWLARMHPDDFPRLFAQASNVQSGSPTFRNEYRLLNHATNTYARILDRGFLVHDESGKLLRVVGAMTDISHLSDIEQAYRASEERFRLVFEESPLGIVIFDHTFHIIQTNASYRRMLGYSQAELLGRSVIGITHLDDQAASTQLATDLFAPDNPVFRVEKRYNRSDGSIVWAAVTATTLPASNSAPALGLAIIEDITQARRVRDELSAANQRAEGAMGAKMRFLAQISHEIRSPMNGVLGMLELLDASPLDAEQRDNISAARQAATSLLGMLEEILDLTRLDQHRLALHPRPYSPVQLTLDIASLYRVKATAKSVDLRASHSSLVPDQHIADPARIRQILINLLDNAIKFTAHGHVAISVSTVPGALQFTVEDTGLGIPEESLLSVFESFSAISSVTSASVGGTGLGLAISQRLARLMGGDITVASRLGQGSCFTLSLPLNANAGTITATPIRTEAPTAFPGRRILVVEDNLINQRVAAGLLRRLHCEVDVAENGVDALHKALAAPYDAIFIDAMMPVMDGFETTVELRRREPAGTRVPVIGLTALATVEDRQRCLDAGMDDYLPKPTNFQALADILSRWLPTIAATPPVPPTS